MLLSLNIMLNVSINDTMLNMMVTIYHDRPLIIIRAISTYGFIKVVSETMLLMIVTKYQDNPSIFSRARKIHSVLSMLFLAQQ